MVIRGFKDVNIVYQGKVKRGSFSIADGKFTDDKVDGALTLPSGLFVAPGFIDEHIHGANGADVMDASIESLERIASSLPQEGVTSFLATTMTESKTRIISSCETVNQYLSKDHCGSSILGLHLEGPFISPEHPGAQDPKCILKPSAGTLWEFVQASGNHVREITFAYEADKGEELLKSAIKHGITPSIGHSDCPGDLFETGIGHGLSCVTHLFNAQKGFHHRDPGIVGEALINDGVKVEVIADTFHVSPDALRLMFRCKKKEDIILISDSTEAKYLSEGETAYLGSQEIHVDGGVAKLQDGTIAGSILRLDQALRNVAPLANGYSFSELIDLVTVNPTRNLGVYDQVGSIDFGKQADFVILDKYFHICLTVVKGHIAYQRKGFSL